MTFANTVGRFHLGLNVEYTHRDANGNVKKLFIENVVGKYLLRFFRSIRPNAINSDGTVKQGLLNHLSAYGLRIPFITGYWSSSRRVSNLVTSAGKAAMASRLNGSGGEAAFTYIAVGTGSTAAAAGDTTLGSETSGSGLTRAAATVARTTVDVTNDCATLTYTFTVSGSVAVTEAGVFNAASSGVLLARQVFSAINVVSGDSFAVSWAFDID